MIRPIKASSGIKLILCCKESLSSASSLELIAVSIIKKKMGFEAWALVSGKMYSMVVKSWMSSAGSYSGEMLLA